MKIRGTILLPASHEEKFMIRSLYRSFSKKKVKNPSIITQIKRIILKINKPA